MKFIVEDQYKGDTMLKRFKRGNAKVVSSRKGLFQPIIVRDRLEQVFNKKDSAREDESESDHKDEFKNINTEQEISANNESSEEATSYHFHFEPSSKYFTICVYVLAVLAIGIVIIQSIINLSYIVGAIDRFLFVIQPFIVAFFIAFIINPIVKTLAENLFHKVLRIKSVKKCLALGILTAYLLIIGLITGFCIYVIPQISDSIVKLTSQSSELYNEFYRFLNKLETRTTLNLSWVEDKIKETSPELISLGTNLVTNLLPKLLNFSISILKLVINILLSIAISVYMLYDKRKLTKNSTRVLYALVPKKKASAILKLVRDCGNIFSRYIVGATTDSIMVGIVCFILMSILRLDYAMLISVIIGVTNLIPYFGPFIGAVPGLLLYLCIDPIKAFIFAIMILILQQIDGWIIAPKILGDSTGLTPLWVIFGITVGGAYGGVFGMFLGVPTVAVVAYLSNLFITKRLEKRNVDIE